jgi:hypothetical protein
VAEPAAPYDVSKADLPLRARIATICGDNCAKEQGV